MVFIDWDKDLLFQFSVGVLPWIVAGICQIIFVQLLKLACVFCPWFCLLICIYWTILGSLEWILLVSLFILYLPVCCAVLQYLFRYVFIRDFGLWFSFLGWMHLCFWWQDSTSFQEWVLEHYFPFLFIEKFKDQRH